MVWVHEIPLLWQKKGTGISSSCYFHNWKFLGWEYNAWAVAHTCMGGNPKITNCHQSKMIAVKISIFTWPHVRLAYISECIFAITYS